VTTEEAFQAHLDAHPDDHFAREVFADWLDEQGDPRGPGMRALGVLKKCAYPADLAVSWYCPCPYFQTLIAYCETYYYLPPDWFDEIVLDGKSEDFAPCHAKRTDATRREVEDAAALAFAKLPERRRAQLLKSNEPAVK
jgi:uncharacterized protein (TIGR02996 family)